MNAIPWLVAVVFCVSLSVTDIREHRLPNRAVAAMTVAVAGAVAIAAAVGVPGSLRRTALVAVQYVGTHAVVYALSRGQFGMGDVKFSLPLGIVVGWYAPNLWPVAVLVSFAMAAAVSLGLLAARRLTLRSRIAFGPAMAVAALAIAAIGATPALIG